MKKIISLILAIIMAMSLWVPAFAVERDSKTGELCETFTFNFDLAGWQITTVETENFMLETCVPAWTAVCGGDENYYTNIWVKEGRKATITRIEARVLGYEYQYARVGVTAGTKRENTNVTKGTWVHVDDINSSEFSFNGGTGHSEFDIIKVYYTCDEHYWGNDGYCELCGAFKCDLDGGHTWQSNGYCQICGAFKCELNGGHTWKADGYCQDCGAFKCELNGGHTWKSDGYCQDCGALKCNVTGEHNWGENGRCTYCDVLKCDVTGEHTWGEDGHCKYCSAIFCNGFGEHNWGEDGHCTYCDVLKCGVTGEHTWGEDGHCKYCSAILCNGFGEHNWGENGHCTYCDVLKCDVIGEHNWGEDGHCKYCDAFFCTTLGGHAWDKDGHCKYCDAQICTTLGEHAWMEDGHCKYCDAFICTTTGQHTWGEDGHCKYCDAFYCTTTGKHEWQSDAHCKYCGAFLYEGSDVIILRTQSDARMFFESMANGNTYKGKKIVLDADIDLGWESPCKGSTFSGELEGNGHRITGIKIAYQSGKSVFGNLNGATISNVTFVPEDHDYHDDRGLLADYVYGNTVINNVKVLRPSDKYSSFASSNNGVFFGVVQKGANLRFKNCYSEITIKAYADRAGGIAGQLYSNNTLELSNTKNYGKITAGWSAGGICAESEGIARFDNAQNYGEVAADGCAGGILGWNSDDSNKFTNCSNSASVFGMKVAGGILGFTGSDDGDRDMYFENCTNSGRIESKTEQAAGIAGKVDTDGTHTFLRVSNTGMILGDWSAGGICADIMGTATFTNATNSGSVTANTKNAGGILSWSENQPITFRGCSNSGAIYAKQYAGGIGGVMYDEAADPVITVDNCKNSGSVTSQNTDAGGIIGALCTDGDCKFTDCKNESGGTIKGARQVGGIFGWTCGNYTLIKNCSGSGKTSTTGSRRDGFYAGTLYGSSENGVTCEGCSNYTASIFTEYSSWIIVGCSAVVIAAVAVVIIRKKKHNAV